MKMPDISIHIYIVISVFIFSLLLNLYTLNTINDDGGFYLSIARETAKNNFIIPTFYDGYGVNPDIDISGTPISFAIFMIYFWSIFFIFPFSFLLIKIMNAVFFAVSVLMVYKLAYILFKNNRISVLSQLIFITVTELWFLSTNIFVDLPVMLFFMTSIYFLIKYNNGKLKNLLLSSFFIASTIMTKTSGIIIYGLLTVSLFFYSKKKIFAIILISLLLISPFLIRNTLLFNDPLYPYLSMLTGHVPFTDELSAKIYYEDFPSIMKDKSIFSYINPLGYLIPLLSFFILADVIYNKNKNKLFLWAWILIYFCYMCSSMFARDIRHLTIITPPLAILSGIFVNDFLNFSKTKLSNNKNLIIKSTTIIIIIFFIFNAYGTMIISTIREGYYNQKAYDTFHFIKDNTPPNSTILTIISGSTHFFTERKTAWFSNYGLGELKNLMNDYTREEAYYVYNKYNIDYILFIPHFTSEEFIQPKYFGAYTYKFMDIIFKSDDYEIIYYNRPYHVFKIGNSLRE